jgi:sn-glycerol 3-phosphate transport system substrate-binding protein
MSQATRRFVLGAAGAFSGALATPGILRAQGANGGARDISFYFPVAVGGPITKMIDLYAADFMRENPTIKVTPIYAGTYQETLTKAQTALKAGSGPQMAVLLSTDVFSLVDDDLILPMDTLAETPTDKAWLNSFYPAFLKNGEVDGHTWGVPFQRSTIVLYWNKAAFRDAGLDPDKAPASWQEQADFAVKLTKRGGETVSRWGIQLPATGFAYWLFQALTTEAGGTLANTQGTETDYASAAAVAALHYWVDLSTKYRAHPPGVVEWGTTPSDFLQQKVAMMWTTTGNLSNIRKNAKFPFGVAMLPADKRRGSPTGGGNFYMFKGATEPQRLSGLKFLRWISSPERAAQWSIDTGYIATRPDAWAAAAMKQYVADFPPAAVARDQLQYAVPELSTHDNQRVTQALNDGVQAALTGRTSPEAALAEAQATATRLLQPFKH